MVARHRGAMQQQCSWPWVLPWMVLQTVVVKKNKKKKYKCDGSTNAAEIGRGVATATASIDDQQADVSTAVGSGPKFNLSFTSPQHPPITESTDAITVDDENNQADFYRASSWTLEDFGPFGHFGRCDCFKVQSVVMQTWPDKPIMTWQFSFIWWCDANLTGCGFLNWNKKFLDFCWCDD